MSDDRPAILAGVSSAGRGVRGLCLYGAVRCLASRMDSESASRRGRVTGSSNNRWAMAFFPARTIGLPATSSPGSQSKRTRKVSSTTLTEQQMEPQTNNTPEESTEEEGGKSRMSDDMKTMAAIMRMLDKHDRATANDIMEYVSKRAKRLAMLEEVDLRR